MAEIVFHVVTEDPQEEHVASDVHEAAMQEHAGEKGNQCGFKAAMAVQDTSDVRGNGP